MRPRLGELLVEAAVIDEEQLMEALALQQRNPLPLGKTLLGMDALDEETLTRTLARQLSVPLVWLRGKRIRGEIVELVPQELIEKHRCLPVQLDQRGEKTLLLAMEDPCDVRAIDAIAASTGLSVRPVLAAPSELDDAIERHVVVDPGDSLAHISFGDDPISSPDLLRLEEKSPNDTMQRAPGDETMQRLGAIPGDETMQSLGAAPADERMQRLGAAPPEDTIRALPPFQGVPEPEPEPPTAAVGDDLVVRALTQLLVEKGIFTRQELIDRIGALDAKASGRSEA